MRSKGLQPLRPESIKEDNPELYEQCFGTGVEDDIMLYVEPDNGYVQNFDAILTIQNQEAWDRMEKVNRERIEALEAGPAGASADPEKIAEALKTLGLVSEASAKTSARSLDVLAAELMED
jgi:hypothetical protein